MAGKNDEYNKVISDLISSCKDAEEGFLKAAEGSHNDDLRRELADMAKRHAGFASELQGCVDDPRADHRMGHGGGVLHAGWVDLEQNIRPKSDSDIITNCLRGEDGVLKHYQQAFEAGGFPADVLALVSRQADQVNEVIEDLHQCQVNVRSAA